MPRTRLPLRRRLAVLSAAFLAAAWAVGISVPASAAPKGFLEIVSVVDRASALGGPVQSRPFDVTVRVLDSAGQPTTVNQATTVVLEEVSGPGVLGGTTSAVIPRNGSGVTISGATYSKFANGVELRARASSGVQLASDQVTVEVALTAVGRDAPNGSFNLSDPNCTAPTATVPNCGQLLLPNGASGHVTLSVGSCDQLGCSATEALVVTAIADLQDRYIKTSPATLILACDKDLCRSTANGVPKIPVHYTFENTGSLTEESKPCPAKGVVGAGQEACVDYIQSSRKDGDLYLYFLFTHDLRISI